VSISRRLFALSRRELAVLTTLFLLSLPAVTPRIYSSDEIEYFSYLRSIWFDGDVSFENEYQYFYDHDVARGEGFHETFLERETEAGRRFNFGTIGCAILWSPFYAAGDVAVRIMRAAGRDVPADGFSQPYIAAVAYGSAFYGFLAVLISIGVARRTLGTGEQAEGLAPAVVVWLGTPLLFYMYVAPPMSHACSAFAVALFVAVWLHARRRWGAGQVVALGFAAALMAMVREQDVFFAAGPALDFLLSQAERRARVRRTIGTAAAGCAAFVLGFLPQLVAYERLNGHMSPSRLVMRKMTWTAPHAAGVLFSPSHGFFFWTPLALAAVVGLVAIAVRQPGDRRRIAAIALLMIALQVYVGGSVESWTVAGAFGQRRFVALTVLLVLGLAGLQAAISGRLARVVLAFVVVLCVWWNLALIALFGTGLMNRQRIELARNAYDVFVTIPRMAPSLAYRYLIDRDSYYRTSPESRTP
jgi:hypothetical protein